MAHTHEGGLTHDHPDGDDPHSHEEAVANDDPRYTRVADTTTDTTTEDSRPYAAAPRGYGVRGGFSLGGIITGVAVALGAVLVLAALLGGIAAAVTDGATTGPDATQLGWAAAIGLIVVQFLAYLWGGYTAGRMARGLGWLNGLMVPVVAIILAVLIGLLVQAIGEDAGVTVPYGEARVPVGIDVDEFRNIGLVAAIGSLVAMFAGAILGGILGARWHDKLEARAAEEPHLRAA